MGIVFDSRDFSNNNEIDKNEYGEIRTLKKLVFIIIVFTIIAGIIITNTKYGNNIEIEYYEKNNTVYQGRNVTLYFDYGKGANEEDSVTQNINKRYVVFNVPDDVDEVKSLRIDFSNDDQVVGIDRIIFHEGIFDVIEISGAELLDIGTFVNLNECNIEGNHLWIKSDIGDSQYIFNEDINNKILEKLSSSKYEWFSRLILLVVLISITVLLFVSCHYNESLLQVILGIAIFLVVYMALVSKPYTHPDEGEAKGAIDYYLTNWKLPIFSDSQFYNTFSPYGDTRLEDMSVYYILTGKFTYVFRFVFHLTGYYRLFGVFVFLLMAILATYWGKKNKAAFIPLLFTPQVWYLFSYATADAWDFFLCYVLIGEILIKDSIFNKALYSTNRNKYWGLAFLGLISALVFMGKPNYYEVLLLAFIILFFRWIYGSNKKDIFRKYLFALFSFVICVGVRFYLDYQAYGFDKMKLYDEAKALHIADAQANYVTLKEQGYSLFGIIRYGFEPLNYKSFVGLYGKMEYHSSTFYYVIIGILYIIILMELFIWLKRSNIRDRISYMCMGLIIPLSYVISLYHSWVEDFQHQGRYLFPILFVIMFLIGCKSGLLERKEMKLIIPAIGCLGIYSYIMYGLSALT